MTIITEIDLGKVRIYCFERFRNAFVVANMIRGIENGDIFPPVPILGDVQGEYQLINGCTSRRENPKYLTREGGHHRTLAHYKTNKPLTVEVFSLDELNALNDGHFSRFGPSNIPLEQLECVKREKDKDIYLRLIETDPNYKRNHCPEIFTIKATRWYK